MSNPISNTVRSLQSYRDLIYRLRRNEFIDVHDRLERDVLREGYQLYRSPRTRPGGAGVSKAKKVNFGDTQTIPIEHVSGACKKELA